MNLFAPLLVLGIAHIHRSLAVPSFGVSILRDRRQAPPQAGDCVIEPCPVGDPECCRPNAMIECFSECPTLDKACLLREYCCGPAQTTEQCFEDFVCQRPPPPGICENDESGANPPPGPSPQPNSPPSTPSPPPPVALKPPSPTTFGATNIPQNAGGVVNSPAAAPATTKNPKPAAENQGVVDLSNGNSGSTGATPWASWSGVGTPAPAPAPAPVMQWASWTGTGNTDNAGSAWSNTGTGSGTVNPWLNTGTAQQNVPFPGTNGGAPASGTFFNNPRPKNPWGTGTIVKAAVKKPQVQKDPGQIFASQQNTFLRGVTGALATPQGHTVPSKTAVSDLAGYLEKFPAAALKIGQTLGEGQFLQGGCGYILRLQTDGNLVLYNRENTPLWNTNSAGVGVAPYSLFMSNDGAAQLFDKRQRDRNGEPIWQTDSKGGNILVLLKDGNIVVSNSVTEAILWATDTAFGCAEDGTKGLTQGFFQG